MKVTLKPKSEIDFQLELDQVIPDNLKDKSPEEIGKTVMVMVMGVGDILSYLALEKSPGEKVSLKILREGDRRTVTVELETRLSTQ